MNQYRLSVEFNGKNITIPLDKMEDSDLVADVLNKVHVTVYGKSLGKVCRWMRDCAKEDWVIWQDINGLDWDEHKGMKEHTSSAKNDLEHDILFWDYLMTIRLKQDYDERSIKDCIDDLSERGCLKLI